jgi:hypothetical protein
MPVTVIKAPLVACMLASRWWSLWLVCAGGEGLLLLPVVMEMVLPVPLLHMMAVVQRHWQYHFHHHRQQQ